MVNARRPDIGVVFEIRWPLERLIGMAKKRGLIPSASAAFERLLQTDFRIAPDLIRGILLKVGD